MTRAISEFVLAEIHWGNEDNSKIARLVGMAMKEWEKKKEPEQK